ncbi:orotidine-5'-phosphate decarboxylase [Demequina sp. TTPB684]|uniref:orotidine-5'-phosphate decarboxylase n=1 Tax=unclassified Demequina TaxID=2620311 RepID=UPI001CF369E0|nr:MULTISPECIES: orotidine-5'-phosphate decarboxylase [unclassified Demequina]MCB2413092.1 orotidine-5'-phosphate decarboxylase [Demequina sp. TTPB684]UPU89256.1 orotidine-5'-phosphate decarboxylase [Demequina sp. TMPB413]
MAFGARLDSAIQQWGPLCVGIDPHPELLARWGLTDTPESLVSFADAVLEASARSVAAVKPNAAFFERHGARGVAALEHTLRRAKELGILTILDVKRGDIGSTMEGYADAYLAQGVPLEADAITVSPFLGFGSLRPAFELAEHTGKGVFVLALTSNPEGASVQHATDANGLSVARAIAEGAAELNAGASPMGSVGLVVGATVGDAVRSLGIDLGAVNGPLLSPGVGAQGASPAEVADVFGSARSRVLVSQSRGVLMAGPFVEKLRGAIQAAAGAAQYALGTVEVGE